MAEMAEMVLLAEESGLDALNMVANVLGSRQHVGGTCT